MIDACMIDGFGWFREGDYRRAWLFFDEVEYLLPGDVRGPLLYPGLLGEHTEFRTTWLRTRDDSALIAAALRSDLEDSTLRELIASLPAADRHYARMVVSTDGDLAGLLASAPETDAVAPLSILSTKLLLRASRTGALPIVGKPYALRILARKLQRGRDGDGGLLAESEAPNLSYTAFAAGLSLRFLSDADLMSVPWEKLHEFKHRHRDLLAAHQLHLEEVAGQFQQLPSGPEFTRRLAELRHDAEKKRADLDAQAHDGWLALGLDLAKKALVSGAAGAVSAAALLRSGSLADILAASLPGVAVTVTAALDAAAALRKSRAGVRGLAYLFEADEVLAAA